MGVLQNKIDLNYIKKLIGDTEVIANPTLDGSETALSGLQIDGVKYIMGGGDLYEHNIRFHYVSSTEYVELFVKVYNYSAEAFTDKTFRGFITANYNHRESPYNKYLAVTGYKYNRTDSKYYPALCMYYAPASGYIQLSIWKETTQMNERFDYIPGTSTVNTKYVEDHVRKVV